MQRPRSAPKRSGERANGLIATAVLCIALLFWGFWQRENSDLSAEEGIGYALGIVGLAMMALLLTYSLRKRMHRLLGAISIRRWFEIHMMLGLAGPTAILFHCNFHLGSLNSTIALMSMIIVSLSGVAGRFMYTKIHHGLLGDRATLGELHELLQKQREALSQLRPHTAEAGDILARFEAWALAPRRNVFASTARFLGLGVRSTWVQHRSVKASNSTGDRRAYRTAIRTYVSSVRRCAMFSTYAWLFGLWHALHLPLCVLLFTAAGIHVAAVHLY